MQNLFNSIDSANVGYISPDQLWQALHKVGILKDDPRLKKFGSELEKFESASAGTNVTFEDFSSMTGKHRIIKKALTHELAIPDFTSFIEEILRIYKDTKENTSGSVADYIPELARVDPEHYALSVCTVDGQRFSHGDHETYFCVQSTCKPVNYCIAHEELGEEKVHKHIGREPSGRSFNEMALNNEGLPHNPLINAGGIMCGSLIQRGLDSTSRFEHILNTWTSLSGGLSPRFNHAVYLSEKQTADRNFALAYFMRENGAFPPDTDIIEALEFYFKCCSVEVNANAMAVTAATLANGGINPLTSVKVFDPLAVKNCLSLMNSCGMYDFSGEFAFKIGLPAKSGVSGTIMIVIPKIMGICLWSPRLDELGNSVRGVEFCKILGEKYNFHNYDILVTDSDKKDPTKQKYESEVESVMKLIWAASAGDTDQLQRLEAIGVDLNAADYDGRTAIHLAASEGQTEVVQFLIDKKVNLSSEDRWGGTPLKDAKREKHSHIVKLLSENGAH